jgi:hypothetical protein
MSRYTYAGDFTNPVEAMGVAETMDGKFYITVTETVTNRQSIVDGNALTTIESVATTVRPHTMHGENIDQNLFNELEDANEWIADLEETFERDYDDYLEENRYSLHQMELYEMWRNEY